MPNPSFGAKSCVGLAMQKQHVIASYVLAPADPPQISAWHRKPHPCNRRRATAFSMSLRASALKWRGNPHPCRNTWQVDSCSGEFVPAADSPKVLLSAMPHRRGYGLPRHSAPPNDRQKPAVCQHSAQNFRACIVSDDCL